MPMGETTDSRPARTLTIAGDSGSNGWDTAKSSCIPAFDVYPEEPVLVD